MTDPQTALDIDLADLGDLVERLAKIARANGVATMALAHAGLSVELSLLPDAFSVQTAFARQPETAIVLTSPPASDSSALVTAPMVGTYYLGTSPGEPPFVAPGDRIEVGQTIGIIEAMKIMNEIPAEVAGTVLDVLVTNGQAVEYGTPLFRITPDIEESA